MHTALVVEPPAPSPLMGNRAVAIANTKWFRALAWKALRDDRPNGKLRAANARAAAWIVLRQAKREAVVKRMMLDAYDAADIL